MPVYKRRGKTWVPIYNKRERAIVEGYHAPLEKCYAPPRQRNLTPITTEQKQQLLKNGAKCVSMSTTTHKQQL